MIFNTNVKNIYFLHFVSQSDFESSLIIFKHLLRRNDLKCGKFYGNCSKNNLSWLQKKFTVYYVSSFVKDTLSTNLFKRWNNVERLKQAFKEVYTAYTLFFLRHELYKLKEK